MLLRTDVPEEVFLPDRHGSVPGLPAELAFLVHHGIARSRLQQAAARADRIGVEPAREILASGLVSEVVFYRALAAELGLPFCEDELAFQPGGDIVAILRHGYAPIAAGGRFRMATAPTGAALRRALETGPQLRSDIVVVTPTAFAAALRRANARSLARQIGGGSRPDLDKHSACRGSTPGQLIVASCCIGPTSFFGTLAPLETLVLLTLLAGPFFLAVIFLRLAAVFEPPALDLWQHFRWRVDDSRLPVYTVAVPLYREVAALKTLIPALMAFDYPAAKLDIRILVEERDHVLRRALAALRLAPHLTVVVVPPGEPRTKPRALNLALLEARGELITVYDAEDVPDPQQLRKAAARFLRGPPELACLQARLVVDNIDDGPLQALFGLEYAGLFDVLNPGLLRMGLPILLGGTSNHFRTAVLRRIGGWDAWNVTEDADMTLRLVRAGYRMGDLPSQTLEEAPHDFRSWLHQRIRWNKGYLQTLITHLKQPRTLLREAGWLPTCTFLALALGGMVSSLVYPVFVFALAAALWDGSFLQTGKSLGDGATLLAGTVTVAGSAALLIAPALGAIRRRAFDLLKWLPALPIYYGFVSVACWLSLVEYVRSRHRWNKTEHGLARNSRYRTAGTAT